MRRHPIEFDANMVENYLLVGTKVMKRSRKAFKSGNKIATVSGFTLNPYTLRTAFTFEEDDSYVECVMCMVAK